jgi:hypothetical protein
MSSVDSTSDAQSILRIVDTFHLVSIRKQVRIPFLVCIIWLANVHMMSPGEWIAAKIAY